MSNPYPLGWIPPRDRTQETADAHESAVKAMPQFAIGEPFKPLNKGEKIDLTELWTHEKVVADIGFPFTRFHQLTGSCVGASLGNSIFTLSAVQRLLATNPTKAFIPYWLFNYGRGRLLAGMRGRGSGSIVSSQAKQTVNEGVLVDQGASMPDFQNTDGLTVSSATEMQFSDGAFDAQFINAAKVHPLGTAAPADDVQAIYQGIVNGAPYHYGCDLYVGHGSIKGSGKDAYVSGRYDTRGGHATSILGVWEHPNDGTLFKYQNNWPKSVYPGDPNGSGSPCSVWITAAELTRMINNLGGRGEGFLYSSLPWFPAQQDELLSYLF